MFNKIWHCIMNIAYHMSSITIGMVHIVISSWNSFFYVLDWLFLPKSNFIKQYCTYAKHIFDGLLVLAQQRLAAHG